MTIQFISLVFSVSQSLLWFLIVMPVHEFSVDAVRRISEATRHPPAPDRRHLIINGFDTRPGEYAFHTEVGGCSGALIAPDVVLTVGHVIPPDPSVGMTVTVGAYFTMSDVRNEQEPILQQMGESRTVLRAIRHPAYDAMHNDFGLLFLDAPSELVTPIPINRSPNFPRPHQEVTLLGTGTLNLTTSVRSIVLQQTTTNYIPNEECSLAYDPERGIRYSDGFLDETNLCTKGYGDGCVFDSGGPVIVNGTLVGLISFGIDCNDPVYPAVNARVSAVSDWIDEMVCQYSKYSTTTPLLRHNGFECSKNQLPAMVPASEGASSTSLLETILGVSTGVAGQDTSASLLQQRSTSSRTLPSLSLQNPKLVVWAVLLLAGLVIMGLFIVVVRRRFDVRLTKRRTTTTMTRTATYTLQTRGTGREEQPLLPFRQPLRDECNDDEQHMRTIPTLL